MRTAETKFSELRQYQIPHQSAVDQVRRPAFRAGRGAGVICATLLSLAALLALSCGTSSSSSNQPPPPPNNTANVVVDAGPVGLTFLCTNCLFTTVTVCAPGTATCQTIDHVLVDTGSYGLRLLDATAGGEFSIALTQQTNASGSVAECAQFADSFTWGPVASADVQIAGEMASSVPVQIIGAATYPDSTAPAVASCTNGGTIPTGDTLNALGANGILGVGVFTDDCGPACASNTNNPGVYFACPNPPTTAASCTVTTEPEANQLQNPVWMFASDNNGLAISLPNTPVTGTGAPSAAGTMTFGLGTQSNNALPGSAAVLTTDGFGDITTQYKGVNYGAGTTDGSEAFLDSGSGAYFILDSATTGIVSCTDVSGFYCPASTVALSPTPTNVGVNSQSASGAVNISSYDTLLCNACTNVAFSDLAGTSGLTFDFGLPFFFGKTIVIGIDGQSTPAGVGPYVAY